VIADSDGHAAILKFAGEELSDENMNFWTAIRDFKMLGGVPEMQAMPGDAEKTSERESPRAPKTEAAAVDDDKLKEASDSIIKTYLMEGAEMAITVSGKLAAQFAKRPKAGVYDSMYSVTMFDQVHKAVHKDIKNDTFARFRLSNGAEELLRQKPMLAVADAAESFGNEKVQKELREIMNEAVTLAQCDRMTAYFVDKHRLFSVCSSMLGNSIIKIAVGKGLAGKAAKTGTDVMVEDAHSDPDFDSSIDLQTGYTTKSVLCVVIKREGVVQAVVQVLNKKGDADGQVLPFTTQDADTIRENVGPPLLNAFEDVALNLVEGV